VAKKDNDTSFIIIKAKERNKRKNSSFKEPTPLIDAKHIARFFTLKKKKMIQ
jgi:hypothetical protein